MTPFSKPACAGALIKLKIATNAMAAVGEVFDSVLSCENLGFVGGDRPTGGKQGGIIGYRQLRLERDLAPDIFSCE